MILHQILVGARAGDAISDHAFALQHWLRELGYTSNIYAQYIHDSVSDQVKPFAAYRPKRGEKLVIFHHSIGDPLVSQVAKLSPDLLLIYHNITPPHYFAGIDPAWAHRCKTGIEQLRLLQPHTILALADSAFNLRDLHQAGYTNTSILPIFLDFPAYDLPNNPTLAAQMQQEADTKLLFVSRFSPNKKQEDLVKLLTYLCQLRPRTQLYLVGDPWLVGYDAYLRRLAERLGVAERMTITGHVSQADMLTYFGTADLYISMSEHEGFGKPLIESMLLGTPVMAYSCTAVPDTMGNAGILFTKKNLPSIARFIHLLLDDTAWQQRLIAQQKAHVAQYSEANVKKSFQAAVKSLSRPASRYETAPTTNDA